MGADFWKVPVQLQKHWKPYRIVVIDDGIIPFKGHWRYRQCVRGKPHSTGIKLYVLADATGFIYSCWYYYRPKSMEKMANRVNEFQRKIADQVAETVPMPSILQDNTIVDQDGDVIMQSTSAIVTLADATPSQDISVTQPTKKKNAANPEDKKLHKLVMDLVYKLPSERKFIIVADQYYGAIHTARAIQRLGHHVLMTIQKNRPSNLIKDFLHKYLKRKGDKSLAVSDDNTLCILSYWEMQFYFLFWNN